MRYTDDKELERSSVVANCNMNRDRDIDGSNGYSKDLGFHPLEYLQSKLSGRESVSWLDICCGAGNALIQAANIVAERRLSITITGVDLVGMFSNAVAANCLTLIEAALSDWRPDKQYDLITCVHGLHYIGDKLGLVQRISSWLTEDGSFCGNLSLENVIVRDKDSKTNLSERQVAKILRDSNVKYSTSTRRLSLVGNQKIRFPVAFVAADDSAGPNYTGQPAVTSHYVSSKVLGSISGSPSQTL